MLTDRYGHIVKIHGLFGTKLLSVSDPKALHHIVMNEQNIYEIDHGAIAINRIVFGMGLLSTLGDHHRKQRKLLNPVFSINHMRHMVPIFRDIATNLRSAIAEQVKRGPREVNMLEWLTRTALELIGQSGLGYSFDDLKGRENPYSKAVKRLAPALFQMFSAERFLPYLVKIGPPSFRKYIVKNAPWKLVREISSVVDVMDKTCIDVFEAKKKALAEGDEAVVQQVDQGKDIMSILLRENTAASEEDRLSDAELLGQMGDHGHDLRALSRILLTLAQHPDVQEKVREEYKQAKAEKGELDYDDLVNLPYLDAVCRETLRLPKIPTHHTDSQDFFIVEPLPSRTAEDSVLTFSTTIKGVDGREINEVLVPKNTQVLISILACNRSRELWGEDALEWKPERWLSPLPSTVTGAQIPGVYSHLMTFFRRWKVLHVSNWTGCLVPLCDLLMRSCSGFKFSQLEMKVVLTTLLESFKFTPTQEIAWTLGLSTPKVKDSKDASYRLPLRVS
ncbi:cytochrome P450 [Melanogaster broomeanus]|nr:cytochrome P450 [Melanogaster broomeanus]